MASMNPSLFEDLLVNFDADVTKSIYFCCRSWFDVNLCMHSVWRRRMLRDWNFKVPREIPMEYDGAYNTYCLVFEQYWKQLRQFCNQDLMFFTEGSMNFFYMKFDNGSIKVYVNNKTPSLEKFVYNSEPQLVLPPPEIIITDSSEVRISDTWLTQEPLFLDKIYIYLSRNNVHNCTNVLTSVVRNNLKSSHLMADCSWPPCLPPPAIYVHAASGAVVAVGYSQNKLIITNMDQGTIHYCLDFKASIFDLCCYTEYKTLAEYMFFDRHYKSLRGHNSRPRDFIEERPLPALKHKYDLMNRWNVTWNTYLAVCAGDERYLPMVVILKKRSICIDY